LHREQLVKGEAAERRITLIKLARPVRLAEGGGERHELMSGTHVGGEWIREFRAELVNQLAYCRTQAECGHTLRQPIDRNDASRIHALATLKWAELWGL
jgi:hypothetical protein